MIRVITPTNTLWRSMLPQPLMKQDLRERSLPQLLLATNYIDPFGILDSISIWSLGWSTGEWLSWRLSYAAAFLCCVLHLTILFPIRLMHNWKWLSEFLLTVHAFTLVLDDYTLGVKQNDLFESSQFARRNVTVWFGGVDFHLVWGSNQHCGG